MLETNKYIKQIENKHLKIVTDNEVMQVQKILMQMIKDLITVFDKYKITYYLGGGTALGAIRHEGFIPWDDDMDLNMFRKDYDKLIQIFDQEPLLKEKYYLCENTYDNEFDVNFMKIKLKGTSFKEYLYTDYSKDGVFIDIFPVENTYNNPIKRKIHGKLSELMLLLCSCLRFCIKKDKYLSYSQEKKYVQAVKIKAGIGKLISVFGINRWLRLSKKVMSCCKDQNSNYITVPTGKNHFFGEMILRNDVLPVKQVKFEDITLPVANNNESYMEKLFGRDYMKIPDSDKREKRYVQNIDLKINNEEI